MTSPVHEHLLGYLLGALDPDEHALVEREIENNPEIKQRLTTLAGVLKPLDYDREHPEYDPPAGLALRTCELLATQAVESTPASTPASTSASTMKTEHPPTLAHPRRMSETREFRGRRGFSMADMVVAAGIFLAASLLFFPALSNSRNQSHLIACQDNLRQIGLGLAGYSDLRGTIPQIPVSGNRSVAGIYAPILYNNQGDGWVVNPKLLKCPSAKFGREKGEWRGVPSLSLIDSAQGEELKEMQRTMGGSYGYNLGYHVNGKYFASKSQSPEFALMSDAPSAEGGGVRSDNHGSRGHNVLFADGHIQYLIDAVTGRSDDHLFRNRLNRIAAGVDDEDSVVGRSDASPFGDQ